MKFHLLFFLLLYFHSTVFALDFEEAQRRVLAFSPQLKMASADIDAYAGDLKQATLYPNPIFSFESKGIDNWTRNGKGSELTYELTQPIEMGGKRGIRKKIATYDYYAAWIKHETVKRAILNTFSRLFINVVAAQEILHFAQERQQIGQYVLKVTQEKFEAGKASLMQYTKAQMLHSQVLLEEEQARLELALAKQQLALLWGSSCADFDAITYPLYEISTPLPLSHYYQTLDDQPNLIQAKYELLAAQKNVQLEKSYRIPDVNLSLGYTTEDDKKGIVVGLGLPLPIFNQNQGNIAKSYARASKFESQLQAVEFELKSMIAERYRELLRAYQTVITLEKTALQMARQLCIMAEEGYREGKFEYQDVLNVHLDRLEIETRHLTSVMQYHYKNFDLSYLTR
jgi:cobalt-zinc-cadmium efflux system outer membrane protein